MDDYARQHLNAWIERNVFPYDWDRVRDLITALAEEEPDLMDLGWPRMRELAESR